jgi:hypothetical protein
VTADDLVENTILQASVLECRAAADAIGLTNGEQNINSLNSSRNGDGGASGVRIGSTGISNVDLSTFQHNVGDTVLELWSRGRVSEVKLCNFVSNGAKLTISSSGQWTIKKCIFLKNDGTPFKSADDTLLIQDSFVDFPLPTALPSIHVVEVTRGRVTATVAITDNLRGRCPGSGTPLTAAPSPTPPTPTPTPSKARKRDLDAPKRTAVPPSKGYFGTVIVAVRALFVGAVALAVCLWARARRGDRTRLLRGDMAANREFIEPIEAEDEDDQD